MFVCCRGLWISLNRTKKQNALLKNDPLFFECHSLPSFTKSKFRVDDNVEVLAYWKRGDSRLRKFEAPPLVLFCFSSFLGSTNAEDDIDDDDDEDGKRFVVVL